MMEDSSRFLSLSGLSGILIGIYALIGTYVAYRMIYSPTQTGNMLDQYDVIQITVLAAFILILSLLTVSFLTNRRAKKTVARRDIAGIPLKWSKIRTTRSFMK